jgi:hypothetical protein
MIRMQVCEDDKTNVLTGDAEHRQVRLDRALALHLQEAVLAGCQSMRHPSLYQSKLAACLHQHHMRRERDTVIFVGREECRLRGPSNLAENRCTVQAKGAAVQPMQPDASEVQVRWQGHLHRAGTATTLTQGDPPSYIPAQCGSRLSRNAVMPSCASASSAFIVITSRVWS